MFLTKVKLRHMSTWTYIQGQQPEPKMREYFYFIDHQGMLFLDDSKIKNFTSCLKDKKFLRFFFNQMRRNLTDRYPNFPYVSICGKERNYVRCDDSPFVYTHVFTKPGEEDRFAHNHAGELLSVKFEPEKIFMLPESGRVYHPAPERVGGVGLIRSQLAIEFSRLFVFGDGENKGPTRFCWNGKEFDLDCRWFDEIKRKERNL